MGVNERVKHIHLIGIAGAGLSAIARILAGKGYRVSGSDRAASPVLEELARLGVSATVGHRAENVHGADLVLASSAVSEDNVEIQEARRLGIPVLRRREFLAWLTQGYRVIAVAGTHGKSTTTAMVAWILERAGLSPTYIIGGTLVDINTNAGVGEGPFFVIEADEYDHAFLGLKPHLALITVVEHDHPDCYPTLEDMKEAFARFLGQVRPSGRVVGCGDEEVVRELLGGLQREVITYGLREGNLWQAVDLGANGAGGRDFKVYQGRREWGPFGLRVPGVHNVKNALGAIAAAYQLGVDPEAAGEALRSFRGLKRRFEVKGEAAGVVVVDDYAHHPTEIRATLAAVRERFPGREVWAVFQPHTYSRTRALLEEFAASFADAHHVIVSDIYAAREVDDLGVSARDIVARMRHPDAMHIGPLDEVAAYLLERLRPGSVLITLGAGDGYKVGERVLEGMSGR